MEKKFVEIGIYDTDRLTGIVKQIDTKSISITPMKPIQVLQIIGTSRKMMVALSEDENIKGALKGFVENMDEDMEIFESIKKAGAEFIGDSTSAFFLILEKAPDTLMEIISIASGINRQQLEHQDMEIFIEVFDAVVEQNDFQTTGKKLGKSLKSLMAKMGFGNRQVMSDQTVTPTLVE